MRAVQTRPGLRQVGKTHTIEGDLFEHVSYFPAPPHFFPLLRIWRNGKAGSLRKRAKNAVI